MKFNDIEKDNWDGLKPYLDTCLLPLTGLTGSETPWQVTEALEMLRDLMDLVEIPYKGRIVTYPSFQYLVEEGTIIAEVNALCRKLKSSQFKYVILISADMKIAEINFEDCDLMITSKLLISESSAPNVIAAEQVSDLWRSKE
jgi:23S rRNA (pseudouridine1915-N3)-methyltransferase